MIGLAVCMGWKTSTFEVAVNPIQKANKESMQLNSFLSEESDSDSDDTQRPTFDFYSDKTAQIENNTNEEDENVSGTKQTQVNLRRESVSRQLHQQSLIEFDRAVGANTEGEGSV